MKNPFKRNKTINKDIKMVTEGINSPIIEPILNHLAMKTTGALLLTGDWGSGKTYHVKKCVFPLIKEKTDFVPIIISLYGETDKNNIIQKLIFAYFDNKSKTDKYKIEPLVKRMKQISDSFPSIKKIVDIDKMILGTSEGIFNLISSDKLLICFDDVERMSDKINVDDFLGIINDLVEGKGCKVLLIAYETGITNGITFKEKTIEKTIHFIPNLSEIFDSLISDYSDSYFKSYLSIQKDFFIETLSVETKDDELNKKLKKSFSNIRTLKFALEHFKIVFELLVNVNDIDELLSSQLRSLWIFTLSISIEFRKPNNISLTDRKKLDSPDISILDFIAQIGQEEQMTTEDEWIYSNNFKKEYYERLSEKYLYYEELYDLITSGKKINLLTFEKDIEEKFNVKEGKVNLAHQLLNSFYPKYYFRYSNEEFVETLEKLLNFCEKGELEDIPSYLNAGYYLLEFSKFIEIKENIIVTKIKKGIDILFSKESYNNSDKYQSDKHQIEEYQRHFNSERLLMLVEHIKQKIKETETLSKLEEIKELQSLFENDFSKFFKNLSPQQSDFRTPNRPILHYLETKNVKQKIKTSTPKDIHILTILLRDRFSKTSFIEYLIDEIVFLNNLKEGISEMDLTKSNLSNYMIQNDLIPVLTEAIEKLQTYIDREDNNGK